MSSKIQQKLQQQQQISDSEDEGQLDSFGSDGSDHEPEEIATFYAKNIAANSTHPEQIGMNEMLEIKSVALSDNKQGDTTFYIQIAKEKYTICTLNANCRQYNVKLLFQVTENPLIFGVTGHSGVSITGIHRVLDDGSIDYDSDEDEEGGLMMEMDGEVGVNDEDEEEEVKPSQKGKIPAPQTKQAPKAEPKKEHQKQEKAENKPSPNEKQQPKTPQQQKKEPTTNAQTPKAKGGEQKAKGGEQNQPKTPNANGGEQKHQNQPKTPNANANANGNKRPNSAKIEGGANKKQKF